MSGYLIDTSALSLFFNGRASPAFAGWLEDRQKDADVYLSVITLQELEKGAAKLAAIKGGSPEKAARIVGWIRELYVQYQSRLLPIDANIALRAGQIEGNAVAAGHTPGLADVLIAATADAHDLIVVTHNLRHFEMLSVRCERPL